MGGRSYVAIHASTLFLFALTGDQSTFAQSVGISIPPRARSVRAPSPCSSHLQARRRPCALSTAHHR